MLDLSVFVTCVFVFFKQKTAYEMRISDWSSDVCSSDLLLFNSPAASPRALGLPLRRILAHRCWAFCTVRLSICRCGRRQVPFRTRRCSRNGAVPIGRASCRERVCQYV